METGMDMDADKAWWVLSILGGDGDEHQTSNPDEEVLSVECLECSNELPDCLAWETLGNKGGDMERATVRMGMDRGTDRVGQQLKELMMRGGNGLEMIDI